MNLYLLILLGVVVLLLVTLAGWLARPKRLNRAYFSTRWQEAQKLCGSKDTWPLAVINADKLVDDALKRRHFKGKTMGERLVAAQKTLTDNDSIWHGHKLRNKLVHEDFTSLREQDVKQALVGFRQALKDLGAL
ncbi:MAG: uncharacterized protein JWM37_800 [Candidatus Saccharibacteria bacterium]|nr:uncharacterized protein [Candidatus Saccharibacteria bacterium]